jgi:pyrroline-5-carboxylate reductase
MTHPGVLYPKMTVIGCGLIGGSIIRAAREHGVVGQVTVADASEAHRARDHENWAWPNTSPATSPRRSRTPTWW